MATLSLFTLILFGTPCFVEAVPRMFDAYGRVGMGVLAESTGKVGEHLLYLLPENSYVVNFPGFLILLSTLFAVTGFNWMPILRFYPIALMLMISLCIYIIASILYDRFSIIAPVLFLSMGWFQEFHLSSQSFALVLYAIIWVYLTLLYTSWENKSLRLPLTLAIIITFGALVTTHIFTPIFIMLSLGTFSLITYIKPLKSLFKYLPSNIPRILIIFSVLFFAYSLFQGRFWFEMSVRNVSQKVLGIILGILLPSLKPVVWSYEYTTINTLRELEVLTINGIAVLLIIIIWFRKGKNRNKIAWLSIWLISCYLFLIFPIFSAGWLIERSALFALLPVSILIPFTSSLVKNFRLRKTILLGCIALITFGSLSLPLLRNANDCFETPSVSSLSATSFAVTNTNRDVSYAGSNTAILGLYYRLNLKRENFYSTITETTSQYDVVLLDDPSYAFSKHYKYDDLYRAMKNFLNSALPKIFDNGRAIIYLATLSITPIYPTNIIP